MANNMAAEFLLEMKDIRKICADEEKRSGMTLDVAFEPVGNGKITLAAGKTQHVMILIGAVAAAGEEALYKAITL